MFVRTVYEHEDLYVSDSACDVNVYDDYDVHDHEAFYDGHDGLPHQNDRCHM